MPRLIKRGLKKAGMAPGTLIHVGDKRAESVLITAFDYDEQNYQKKTLDSIADCAPYMETSTVTWVNIDGLHDVNIIESAGKMFDLHPLTMEDILNTSQRPKAEAYESYIFTVLKMLRFDNDHGRIQSEQISLILSEHVVLSFQECVGDVFDPVRERIENTKWRIRRLGADYLLYALIDSIVDHYFVVLEKLGDKIETLQEQVAADPSEETLQSIHELKHELLFFRKSAWPVRDLINTLLRSESSLIAKETMIYLRDIYDHVVQVIDGIENYREMATAMLDVYLSSISNRMNSVMKVLTIIATIFIPLTFLAGVYGMNFKYMPELDWPWAYPALWGLMIAVVMVMLWFFRKQKWL